MGTEPEPHRSNRSPQSDWKVWQDADIATNFVEDRRAGIPGAAEQFAVLHQLLPVRAETASATVLDLGCGDGILLETLLNFWPGAKGVGLDGSAAMLEKAAIRLEEFSTVSLIEADFNYPDWREKLPQTSFDVVVSGFAIHHSEDERKRALYTEIYDVLAPGGLFVNIEHVASATARGEILFERNYAAHLWQMRQKKGEQVTYEQVLSDIVHRLDKSANRLTPVETQLQWLREIGFVDVDCYWKQYELAVLAGFRN